MFLSRCASNVMFLVLVDVCLTLSSIVKYLCVVFVLFCIVFVLYCLLSGTCLVSVLTV